jgi:hypothetical protein
MRIGDALQVLVVSLAELVIGLLLFVYGYAFSKYSLGGKSIGAALEVEDEHFEDNWNSQLANLVIFQLIYLLGDEGIDGFLKLMLLPLLFLRHFLSEKIHSVIPQRRISLILLRKFLTVSLGDKPDELLHVNFEFIAELLAVVDGGVALVEEAARDGDGDVVHGPQVEGGLDQYERHHLLQNG